MASPYESASAPKLTMICASEWRRWKPAISSSRRAESFTFPSGPGLSFFNKARFISLSRSVIDKISPTRRVISAVRPSGSLISKHLNRGRIGGDAEQTWSRLVVQFVSDLAPLLLLHTDQLAIQPAILIARSAERARKRIEAFGEDAQLLYLWQSKPRRITALLKTEHAPGEMGKRIEEAA